MRARATARALLLEAGLGGVMAVLWEAGTVLPAPPLTAWSELSRWYASVDPGVAMAALVRLGALAVTAWLVVATAGQLVVGSGAPAAIRRAADLIAPRSLQRFVHGLAGLSLSAGLAVVVPSAGTPAAGPTGVAVLRLVTEPPPGTATLRLVPEPAPAATPMPVAPAPVAAAAPSPTPPAEHLVVEPGDSLWSIAEEVLLERGADPDDLAVERYWRRLVDANRRALVDPANPDLIYPGQELTLPAP